MPVLVTACRGTSETAFCPSARSGGSGGREPASLTSEDGIGPKCELGPSPGRLSCHRSPEVRRRTSKPPTATRTGRPRGTHRIELCSLQRPARKTPPTNVTTTRISLACDRATLTATPCSNDRLLRRISTMTRMAVPSNIIAIPAVSKPAGVGCTVARIIGVGYFARAHPVDNPAPRAIMRMPAKATRRPRRVTGQSLISNNKLILVPQGRIGRDKEEPFSSSFLCS